MNNRNSIVLLALLFALLLLPATILADTETEMSADQQAMMEAWQKAATPGEEHAEMADHAGTWKVTVESWMEPGAEPMVSQGVFHRELVLGGRVLQERYEGEFDGEPFEGLSHIGYDNVTGRWWTTWTDNMSTGPMVMWGEWSEEENGVVYHGETPDPMSGGMVKMKTIVRYPDKNKEVVEMFDLRSGEPVKTMEIVAIRE